MSREKAGYRDTIAQLNEMFPDKGCLSKPETAKFLGVHRNTLDRYVKTGKIRFNDLSLISKADLARQICT